MNFSTSQFAKLAAGLSASAVSAPAFSKIAYLIHELFVGDTISTSNAGAGFYVGATVGSLGNPNAATPTPAIYLGAANKGTSYTLLSGDMGSSAQIQESMTNSSGTATGSSNIVPVTAVPTVYGYGQVGGNVSMSADYNPSPFFNNCLFDSRGLGLQSNGNAAGNGTGTGWAIDANGWPTTSTGNPTGASQVVLTAVTTAGVDGQMAAGVYQGQFQSTGASATIPSLQIATNSAISNIVNTGGAGAWNTTFTLTLTAGAVCQLAFNAPFQNLVIPRDGTSNFSPSLFYTPAIAYYAQFGTLRLMDMCVAYKTPETTWSTRIPNYQNIVASFGIIGNSGAYDQYAWETIIQFINAVATYSGSKLKSAWINTGGYITADYGTGLSALLNSYPINSGLKIYVEVGNEPWNGSFVYFGGYLSRAATEVQALVGPAFAGLVTSVVSNGTTCTITVSALPSFLTAGNSYPAIFTDVSSGTWNFGTPAAPISITAVNSTTLTFPCTINATMTSTDQFAIYFNLASNLINDGLAQYNYFYLLYKWMVRAVYTVQQAWQINRPADGFLLNLQQYDQTAAGTNPTQYSPVHFPYAAFLGGGSASWLYGAAIAPYINMDAYNPGWTGVQATDLTTIFAKLNLILTTTATYGIQSHIFMCRKYAIAPMIYEAAADITGYTFNGAFIPALCSDARMGTLITSLLNVWFNLGGNEFNFFATSPSVYQANTSGSVWSLSQSYSSTTDPMYVALTGYAATARSYVTSGFSVPGTVTVANYMNSLPGSAAGTAGAMYWSSNAVQREIDFLALVNRSSRFNIVVSGYDAAATVATIIIDGVSAGTVTMGGSGSGGSGTIGASSTLTGINLSSGAHQIGVQFAANAGTSPGVYSITLTQA